MSKTKIYSIRYNTQSTDDTNRWRLIENGKEVNISKIIINGHIFTTKDWVNEINDYKYHITCQGNCRIENNIAYIDSTKEQSTLIRHILKTVSYRFLGTLTTVVVAFSLGATIETSTLLGIGELLIKPILYFLHERVWYKKIRINENHGR
jgi:uncharacterized membrane protein